MHDKVNPAEFSQLIKKDKIFFEKGADNKIVNESLVLVFNLVIFLTIFFILNIYLFIYLFILLGEKEFIYLNICEVNCVKEKNVKKRIDYYD